MAEEKIIPRPRIQQGNNSSLPWSGQKSAAVLAVDPGNFGGICAGSSIDDVRVIPYPRTSLECRDFCRRLSDYGIELIGCAFYYENRPKTDQIPGGAKRVYRLGFDDGMWFVISGSFHQKVGLYPASWRRIAYPTIEEKPVGSMEWKKLEFRYLKFFTGDKLVKEDKFYKSDNSAYGVSAAFSIWLAGAKSEGLIDIEQEIKIRKEKNKGVMQ